MEDGGGGPDRSGKEKERAVSVRSRAHVVLLVLS